MCCILGAEVQYTVITANTNLDGVLIKNELAFIDPKNWRGPGLKNRIQQMTNTKPDRAVVSHLAVETSLSVTSRVVQPPVSVAVEAS